MLSYGLYIWNRKMIFCSNFRKFYHICMHDVSCLKLPPSGGVMSHWWLLNYECVHVALNSSIFSISLSFTGSIVDMFPLTVEEPHCLGLIMFLCVWYLQSRSVWLELYVHTSSSYYCENCVVTPASWDSRIRDRSLFIKTLSKKGGSVCEPVISLSSVELLEECEGVM